MRAATVLASTALALFTVACGSSPNDPPPDAGWAHPADAAGDAEAGSGDGGTPVDGAAPDSPGGGVGLTCPPTFMARADGTPCFSVLTACDYPEGRCGCLICEMGAQAFGYAWSCRPWNAGGAGCPERSPPMGSPCDSPGLKCRFGAYCSVSVGDDLECSGGTWQPAPPLDACGYRSCPF
jgi:hypothetical protein